MDLREHIELLVLNVPLIASLVLVRCLRIYPRLRLAIVLGILWQLAALPWLNWLAQHQGWWDFSPSPAALLGMPLGFYLGWVLWWGVVATVLMGKLPFRAAAIAVAVAMLGFDLCAMPMLAPALELGDDWLLGESLLIVFGLLPGLWLAHVTLLDQRLEARAWLIALAFATVMLTILPLVGGRSLDSVLDVLASRPAIWNWALAAFAFVVSVPGMAAVVEFARAGRGTPIPFDPPRRLVTGGVYAYTRNPMQLSAVLLLLAWAGLIGSWLCVLVAAIAVIYSCGVAAWSEGEDLRGRFGAEWQAYRTTAPAWRYRLVPQAASPPARATLYVAMDCAPCSQIARWFSNRGPQGLELADAANWPGERPLQRITYLYPDGETSAQGVTAIACALQHLHLGWAWLGWLMQVPGIHAILQRAMDTSLD